MNQHGHQGRAQWQINAWKDEGFRKTLVDDKGDYFQEKLLIKFIRNMKQHA